MYLISSFYNNILSCTISKILPRLHSTAGDLAIFFNETVEITGHMCFQIHMLTNRS